MTDALGTRGFSRLRQEFSMLAEGRHIFGHRPKQSVWHTGQRNDNRATNPIVELPANKPKPVHPHDQILSVIYFSFSFLTIRLLIKHSPHVRPHQEGGPVLRIFLVRIEREETLLSPTSPWVPGCILSCVTIGSLTNPIKNSPTPLAFHTEVPRALSHMLLCHELGGGTRDESLRMSA